MLTPEILSMLWCPTCQKKELDTAPETVAGQPFEEGELRCTRCKAVYPVRFGVPHLIPHDALTGNDWKLWRDHLAKFEARRKERIDHPDRPVTRLAKKSQPQPAFARFTAIQEGTLLDVGCGPGKLRSHFDLERVQYVGLDPIALPEVADFPFVQSLAESIPFKDATFTDVTVLAALDHFRDKEGFLAEVRRVLKPGGRLHILQSVHEVRGPISAVKVMAHKVKDGLEERSAGEDAGDVPKHLTEFTSRSLLDWLQGSFDLVASERYSATWYSPVKVFLSSTPKDLKPTRPSPSGGESAEPRAVKYGES